MNRMDRVDAFQFDDDKTLDDQIDPVPKLDLLPIENYRQPDLAGHRESALSDFMRETTLIAAFQ